MLQTNLVENYITYSHSIITTENRLDTQRFKKILIELGFNPISTGTQYIIEELEFFYNNNIFNIKNLNQAYSISAQLHSLDIKNIQWNVESAIFTMNRYANTELTRKIFYWYGTYQNITPKFFFNTMLEFLDANKEMFSLTSKIITQ